MGNTDALLTRQTTLPTSPTPPTETNSSDDKPLPFPVYKAKYSGVDVYELAHPTGSVMKRKRDNWVNATHILKAANFAKAKRTRILEKDVMDREHEKIQGGFGKYQGTWVPLSIAEELSRKYNVYDELKNLLDYVFKEGEPEPEPAPKHTHAVKKDAKNSTLREPTAGKKQKKKMVTSSTKISDERSKVDRSSFATVSKTSSMNSFLEGKRETGASTGLRSFLPDDHYMSTNALLGLSNKRSFSDVKDFDGTGKNASKHRKPVKLQRSNTNKNSLMVADPHYSASKITSPVSNHQMIHYLTSAVAGPNSSVPLHATRTNTIKLPSLVAAANVAFSPSSSGNNNNNSSSNGNNSSSSGNNSSSNASGVKIKPHAYSPSQSNHFGNFTRPASRMNSFNNNGITIKSITGIQTASEDASHHPHALLPSLSALSSQKRNLTYSPPVFNKPYLSNTPSFLQTPRVATAGNNAKHHTSNYRQTPLKLDDALSGELEPMTPFFNPKQSIREKRSSDDATPQLNASSTIYSTKENDLLRQFVDAILSTGKMDFDVVKRSASFAHFQSFKVINASIDSMGNTLLHLACGTGSVEIVDFLLQNCAVNPFETNKRGESCLMQAFIFKNCQEKQCLEEVMDLFEKETLYQMLRIRDAKGENALHVILRFCQRYRQGNAYLKHVLRTVDGAFLRAMLLEQNIANGDTPLHLCQRNNDLRNYRVILDALKAKYSDDKSMYEEFLTRHLYTVRNKEGRTCDASETSTINAQNANYIKYFARINCEIVPKIQAQLMALLNTKQQSSSLKRDEIRVTEKKLSDLEREIANLAALSDEIDEMKFMLELNNLHNTICSKKLETLEEINAESKKTDIIINEDDIKIAKLRELKQTLNAKTRLSKQVYDENRVSESDALVGNCRRLVAKYMDVDIHTVNEQLIESMIADLEKTRG